MSIRSILESIVSVDSVWSIVFRVGIWMLIVITIVVSVDSVGQREQLKSLKSNLGLFLLITVLGFAALWFFLQNF